MDDHIIFGRTPVGTQVARDPNTSLPRAMRTLLLAVDGRTRVSSYRMILNHLGDVGLLFEGLENAGYIARMEGNNTRVAAPSLSPLRNTNANQIANDLRSLSAATSFPPTINPTIGSATDSKNFEVLAKIQEAQSHFTHNPPTLSRQFGSTSQAVRTANLNTAKSLMIDFLGKHLPEVAMEISLSLDRIDSFDELERSLPDYSQLVAKLGKVSVDHLRQVRALINR